MRKTVFNDKRCRCKQLALVHVQGANIKVVQISQSNFRTLEMLGSGDGSEVPMTIPFYSFEIQMYTALGYSFEL